MCSKVSRNKRKQTWYMYSRIAAGSELWDSRSYSLSIAYFLFLYYGMGSPQHSLAVAFLILTLFFTAFISHFLQKATIISFWESLWRLWCRLLHRAISGAVADAEPQHHGTTDPHFPLSHSVIAMQVNFLCRNLLKEFKTTRKTKIQWTSVTCRQPHHYALLKGDVR